jgi:hypothetical protein
MSKIVRISKCLVASARHLLCQALTLGGLDKYLALILNERVALIPSGWPRDGTAALVFRISVVRRPISASEAPLKTRRWRLSYPPSPRGGSPGRVSRWGFIKRSRKWSATGSRSRKRPAAGSGSRWPRTVSTFGNELRRFAPQVRCTASASILYNRTTDAS